MTRQVFNLIMMICISIGFLTGCQKQDQKPAARVVESYLQALVAEDSNRISNLVCKDWEEQAQTELDAFIGVKASLKDMTCDQTGNDGPHILVQCKGTILATYNNENQELTLEGRTYRVIQDNGDWYVCGYK